jgi:predicted RNA binding protein YcfA (HicA-like mRNA interferase family)
MTMSRYDGCKDGHSFIQKAKKHPCLKSERQSGSHWQGTGPDGRITIADHNRELPPFLRRKISKELVAIGLGLLILALWQLPNYL